MDYWINLHRKCCISSYLAYIFVLISEQNWIIEERINAPSLTYVDVLCNPIGLISVLCDVIMCSMWRY